MTVRQLSRRVSRSINMQNDLLTRLPLLFFAPASGINSRSLSHFLVSAKRPFPPHSEESSSSVIKSDLSFSTAGIVSRRWVSSDRIASSLPSIHPLLPSSSYSYSEGIVRSKSKMVSVWGQRQCRLSLIEWEWVRMVEQWDFNCRNLFVQRSGNRKFDLFAEVKVWKCQLQ